MKGFTKTETEELLREAVKANSDGKSLSEVFFRIAEKTGRAKGSVRNYYYNLIKSEERKNAYEKIVKGVKNLKATKFENFSDDDLNLLLQKIKEGKSKGKSVRSVIQNMAKGDQKLALRFQNKYRNYLKSEEKAGYKEDNLPLKDLPVRAEDYLYFSKLSEEIDGLVEKIKDKYATECVKLKTENDELKRENKLLKKRLPKSNVPAFFFSENKRTNR